MSAIYYQIELYFLINRDPFFYYTLPTLIIELCVGHNNHSSKSGESTERARQETVCGKNR